MNKVNCVFTSLVAFAFVVSMFCIQWPTLGQTSANQNESANANTQDTSATTRSRSKNRRAVNRKSKAVNQAQTANPDTSNPAAGFTPESVNPPAPQANTTATGTTPRGRKRARPSASTSAGNQTKATTEQTDLSGTYEGVMNCPDVGITGDTTLTITGDQFTLTDGKTGRIVASTTRGYTAAAMQFGDSTPSTTGMPATPPTVVSVRARKTGDRLVLSPVPGGRQCSFTSSRGTARSRRNRGTQKTPDMSAGEQPAAGETPGAQPATPMPRRTSRRGSRSKQNQNANMNVNANENTNTNDNTGVGNPNANSNANVSPTPTPTPPQRQ